MNYISIQSSRDVIEHFGIKGMRWGHRNRREYLVNRYMNKGYDPQSAEAKAQKRLKTEKYLKRAALVGGVALGAYMGYKGTNYIINQKRAKDIARGLKKMNAIREENSMVKKGKFDKLKSAGRKLADKAKDVHRKDTEKFMSRVDYAMLKNAAKKVSEKQGHDYADKIISVAQKKPGILGRRKLESIGSTKGKLGKIVENFAKAQSQVRKNSKSIDSFDAEALERVKKLMKK
nr:MAG TPA: hypothetical protein [Caudoviricetes sp.]